MKLIFPVIDAAGTGANILALRRQRGLSVREVQEWFGFDSPRAIYKWQKGQTLPSVDNLYALSVLLGVSMEQILVPQKRQMGTTEEKTQLQERIAAAFFCWCCRFCEILSVNPGLLRQNHDWGGRTADSAVRPLGYSTTRKQMLPLQW